MRRVILLISAMLAITSSAQADIKLTDNGVSSYCVIVANNASPSEKYAASEFQKFIDEISGAKLSLAPDEAKPPKNAVLIGDSEALRSLRLKIDFKDLGNEGYVIKTVGNRLIIAGGKLRGTMYGVYAFLEDTLGCRWYSSKVSKIPHIPSISLTKLNVTSKPAFEYRDTNFTEAYERVWAARNKLNGMVPGLDDELGGAVTYYPFCHTFNRLVPVDQYWDTHPEYFSMVNGKRIKDKTQLCMSNPEVVRIATQTVLQWIKDHPKATLYSVTQNDWDNHCQCPECKKIDEEEGSPSGLMLRFVNAIADEVAKVYPDKLIDTFAYTWTEKPPKITKPHANVRVRLCPIYCCEAHPYETCDYKANKAFMDNLNSWANITDCLYIWHYNTDYSHYQNPFPDFRQFPDSAKLYKKHHVKGIFWEGNYNGGASEFGELRSYMLAKLTWNPDLDADAIMKDFITGYYGEKSGEYILKYIDLLEDKVTKDDIHVTIWTAPNAAFLTPDIVKEADYLLDKAEYVAESPEILDRVRRVHLSIEYVKLMGPIMRKECAGKEDAYFTEAQAYVEKCKSFGVTKTCEWLSCDEFLANVKKQLGIK